MFFIDRCRNEAIVVTKKSFLEIKMYERQHLQEWIDKNPEILGEPLLIIQKEFSDFSDTYERLDLLALDKHGDLVIIENKLDDSGKDVVWQSLRYVSYCASLSKTDIRDIYDRYLRKKESAIDAETAITDFLEANDFDEIKLNSGDQRIILVAAAFRKEVTSTVMWLLDHNVSIRCIKVTPYEWKDQLFLDTEQVLPPPDTEELRVRINNKKQEEYKTDDQNALRHNVRLNFWKQAIPQLQKTANLYHNVSPTRDNWISGASGYGGISYNCVVTKKTARAELYIGKPSAEENRKIYDNLYQNKDAIEHAFGELLSWDRLDEKKACRISIELSDVNVFEEEDWPQMISFLGEKIKRLHDSLSGALKEAVKSHSM